MQRLVYAPKVYAYVRVQNPPTAGSDVIDLSPFITAGNVSRVLNQVSTAELTLRNPDHRFTITESHANMFHPMDPITIYLTRLPNRPIQVFTGYLDEVPYLQLFPGTVTLKASCTLKRLLYTFFDPALPYMINFMGKYGWIVDKSNGQALNFNAQVQSVAETAGQLTDGSVGNLLYATLNEIGNWNDKNIFIEKLPKGIASTVVKLYSALAEENKQAEKEFENLMSGLIGSGSYGSGGQGSGGSGTSTGQLKSLAQAVPKIVSIANQHGLPPVFVLTVAEAESGIGQTADTPGNSHTGLFQQSHSDSVANSPRGIGPPYPSPNTWPTFEQTHDTGLATTLFCRAAVTVAKANPNFLNKANWRVWGETTQGAPGQYTHWNQDLSVATQYYNQFGQGSATNTGGGGGASGGGSGPQVVTKQQDPNNPHVVTKSPSAKASARQRDAGANTDQYSLPLAAKYLKGDPKTWGRIDQGQDIETAPVGATVYSITPGTVQDVKTNLPNGAGFGPNYPIIDVTGGPLKGRTIYYGHVDPCLVKPGDKVDAGTPIAKLTHVTGPASQGHIEIGFWPPGSMTAGGEMQNVLRELVNGNPIKPSGDNGGGAGNTDPTSGQANVLANAKASAFATYLNFPSIEETAEAVMLQGAKSLMNDKPLFPFIEQLCQASMRSFQSAPNGDFWAFYPDWFGSFGKTVYWNIDELEVLDGGIQLSDDALATHVFVVGDTIPGVPIGLPQMLSSGGVVNVFNAFQDNFIKQGKASPLATHNKAEDFLKHYGPRPVYLEEAFIRSPYFEAFYAYQQFCILWSQQFSTPFQLTFMPELYPGGLVRFPNQNLQCYIESVSHSWDYTSGFTSDVVFSAPAALSNTDTVLGEGMILAGKGGIN